ncbi:MAG TPA: phosphoglucosamine mutase [Bacillota bacterium]|nr:phosphoglucosamine mutase [Bacillota bacterium]HOL08670.1 phosphoglucosamine mutase [Bacillota bacterium]HPO96628.1 phosphoglucosamine mutase [Bacillota bacterium]
MGRLFGTDGVRGVANQSLTPELAFGLGRATGGYFSNNDGRRTKIIIGRDTRLSGEMLEAALAAGITSTGADVILLGIIPTPGVAYLCRELGADAGVMISASHNPVEDNGIKIFDSSGFKLTDAVEDEIEDLYQNRLETINRPVGTGVGRIITNYEAIALYQKYLQSSVNRSFKGLKIVVDCGYGAAYRLAPTVLKELGAEVIALNAENDGSKINVKCGSTNIEQLRAEVLAQQANLGIAHDGDADRIIAVDETGQMIDGDQIMTICGLQLLKEGKLRNNKIAVTVYSNLGLIEAFRKHNADVVITANGDRYVLEALKEHNLVLGGEQSGHIIFYEKNTTGDGVMTALQLVAVMVETGKKLSELASQMNRFPQVLENVRVTNKEGWETNEAIKAVIAEVEQQLGATGRLFVRASGTEPLIRVMAEGPDEAVITELVKQVAAVIKREQG